MNRTRSVLFDMDGTLLDTAPDIASALNQVRERYSLPSLPMKQIRPAINLGVKALLTLAGDISEHQDNFEQMRDECLSLYQERSVLATRLFPGMEQVLQFLDDQKTPWGIVTNKPARFVFSILKQLDLEHRAACIVCGDTLPKHKPEPDTILHACHLIQEKAGDVVYVGDSIVDATASKAAGTTTLIALYGYIDTKDDPFSWRADDYIRDPLDVIDWLKAHPLNF